MKICTTCKKEKSLEEFSKSKYGAQGREAKCKECYKSYWKDYSIKNKEKVLQKSRDFRKDNKEKVTELAKKCRENRRDGYYKIYHLPNHTVKSPLGYIGNTFQGIEDRLRGHRDMGRDTSGYRILHSVKTFEEALRLEVSYIKRGYDGGLNGRELKFFKSITT